MDLIKKFPKMEHLFYIGIFMLTIKSILSHSTLLPLPDLADELLSILSCCLLAIPCLFKKYSHKSMIICLIIVLSTLITSLNIGNVSIFIPVLVIIASYREDLYKLIYFVFKIELLLFILHILFAIIFSFFGFEILYIKSGGIVTLSLGFSHPNILSLYVLNLISMWVWLNYEFINKKDCIIIGIISLITFLVSKSRTPFICIVLLFGLIFIHKYLKWNKIFDLTKFVFPICSIVTIVSVLLYPYNIKIINLINLLFSKRIQLGSKGLLHYGFSLFGQNVYYYKGFTFDNIYNVLFVNYGIIWIVILSCLFYFIVRKGNVKNNIFIKLWCFYGFTEIHGINPFLYFPLFILIELLNDDNLLCKIDFLKKYS